MKVMRIGSCGAGGTMEEMIDLCKFIVHLDEIGMLDTSWCDIEGETDEYIFVRSHNSGYKVLYRKM